MSLFNRFITFTFKDIYSLQCSLTQQFLQDHCLNADISPAINERIFHRLFMIQTVSILIIVLSVVFLVIEHINILLSCLIIILIIILTFTVMMITSSITRKHELKKENVL